MNMFSIAFVFNAHWPAYTIHSLIYLEKWINNADREGKREKKSKNAEERAQQSIRIATKHFISNQFVHLVRRDLQCCVRLCTLQSFQKQNSLTIHSIYTTHTHTYWKMFNLMKEVRCGENVECNETTVHCQKARMLTYIHAYTLNVQMNSWGASFIYVIVIRIRNIAAYAFLICFGI